jgi:hypothetical protein
MGRTQHLRSPDLLPEPSGPEVLCPSSTELLGADSRPFGERMLREERVWRDGGRRRVVIVVILSGVTVAQRTNAHK